MIHKYPDLCNGLIITFIPLYMQTLTVLSRDTDWWLGHDCDNATTTGYFPSNYVQLLPATATVETLSKPRTQVKAKVLYRNDAVNEDDLSIHVGQVIIILEQTGDWWYGCLEENEKKCGFFPKNYIQLLPVGFFFLVFFF